MTLNVFRFVTLFSGVLLCPLAYFIYFSRGASRIHKYFGAFIACAGLWSLGFFLTMFDGLPYGVALWSSRFSHFFGSMTAIFFYRFAVLFTQPHNDAKTHHHIIAGVAAISTLTPWFIPALVPKLFFPYYPNPGPLYVLLLVTYFYTFATAFRHLLLELFGKWGDRVRRV